MSDQSTVNLEFLKKEAKTLLKQCRSGDSEALGRIRTRLPHLADIDDTRAGIEIKLADVQHVLAQELGCANWGNLKRRVDQSGGADFSKPGSAGELPDDFTPWKWGVSYTVRPELLSPLVCGEEYRIGASVLRSRPDDATCRGYADLYERANMIVRTRAAQLMCSHECEPLRTRILAHMWFRHGTTNLVRAAVTLGVTCLKGRHVGTGGESYPTLEALAVPGGMTPEQLTEFGVNKRFDEVYSDGDLRTEADSNGIFTFSYGEYVKTVEGIDYKTLIKRAEDLTAFHMRLLRKSQSSVKLNILKREWFYATNPDIGVIHIYVRP
jgi:hypothetical protein